MVYPQKTHVDDPAVRGSLAALLEGWGVEVAVFADLASTSHPGTDAPDALVVDLELPDGSGLSLADAHPDAGVCVVSGASESALAAARERGLLVLRKPVEPVRLRAALEHLLGG